MTRAVKQDFTNEQIIQVVLALGSQGYREGKKDELIFQTVCHHGSSYKLYYYPENKLFHCYTDCGDSFDLYHLVQRSRNCSYDSAVNFVYHTLGIGFLRKGFVSLQHFTDDWELFRKYQSVEKNTEDFVPQYYPTTIIDYYLKFYPYEWLEEGITEKTMDKFFIRFDVVNNRIVIPQFDINGGLIGVRARCLNEEDVEAKRKYIPVTIQDTIYRHPTNYNLYGLYQNQNAIRRIKKILLFEAEKSVMKCDGFYGDSNFTVAVCGSAISNYQRSLILSLGVTEVFIAFDKEYHHAYTEESDKYAEKIYSLAYKFAPYVTTYVLWDVDDLLGYKDSPADKGKEVLEKLMLNKFEVQSKEDE